MAIVKPHDRWIEIDMSWFDSGQSDYRVSELMQTIVPLFRGADGHRGLILNTDWLVDLAMLYTGDPQQRLPLTGQRYEAWCERSYIDFANLLAAIKTAASEHGIDNLKIGLAMVGWGRLVSGGIYSSRGQWIERHDEIYQSARSDTGRGPDSEAICPLWLDAPLHADKRSYAAFPGGWRKGTRFTEVFAGQWSELVDAVGLDALVCRDAFHGRPWPEGPCAGDQMEQRENWQQAVMDHYRAIAHAAPQSLVIGYSSTRSACQEFIEGQLDLTALIAGGCFDAWIDQTWGGAWEDWYSAGMNGWTHQLARLLAHRVMIQRGNVDRSDPCRHYCIIESADAYEPWDTLHRYPGKLRWAIWAYLHAAYWDQQVLETIDGVYLSGAMDRRGALWSQEDVDFLRWNLDAAVAGARSMRRPMGPVWLFDPDRLTAQRRHGFAGEGMDIWIGMLSKWAVGTLAVCDARCALPEPDGWLIGSGSDLTESTRQALRHQVSDGVGLMAVVRGEELDPWLAGWLGVGQGERYPSDYYRLVVDGQLTYEQSYLKDPQSIHCRSALSEPIFGAEHSELIIRSLAMPALLWHPPSRYAPRSGRLAHHQFGSLLPFSEAASAWQLQMQQCGRSFVEPMDPALPVSVHLWEGDGELILLAGNLESTTIGDARLPRILFMVFDLDQLQARLDGSDRWQLVDMDSGTVVDGEYFDAPDHDGQLLRFQIDLGPESSCILQLKPADESGMQVDG